MFILAEDYQLYEIADVTTSEVMDLKTTLNLTEPPLCMCAGATYTRHDVTIDLYVSDPTGSLLQVGKEDCLPVVCILFFQNSFHNYSYFSIHSVRHPEVFPIQCAFLQMAQKLLCFI